MLPTPSTSHVNTERIYEPAEDSFLILDTLSSATEVNFLTQRFSNSPSPSPAPLVLEIGSGSGVVLAFITAHAKTLFGRADVLTLGADVNGFACEATKETVRRACENDGVTGGEDGAGIFMGAVQSDLNNAVRRGMVDVLVFNPPYVPTPELPGTGSLAASEGSEIVIGNDRFYEDSRLLSLSYAGGKDGMEVTNRLLEQLQDVLSMSRGVAYILLCQQNDPQEVTRRIGRWGSPWAVESVRRSGRTGGWEKLHVIRIWRRPLAENDKI